MFRDKAIFLLVISALLIPLIFITNEFFLLGFFIMMFIALQIALVAFFYKEESLTLQHWYAFWTAILSLAFLLAIVILGRNAQTEFLGLLMFLIYFIGMILLLFQGKIKNAARKIIKPKKPEKRKSKNGDVESFRKKDQLKELVDFFEAEEKPKSKFVDIEEPKVDKILFEREDDGQDDEEYFTREQRKKEDLKEEEADWDYGLPKSTVFENPDEDAEQDLSMKEKEKEYDKETLAEIKELKEAPGLEFQKASRDMEQLRKGVNNISDTIREISERAILDGAKKKINEKKISDARKKLKKSETKVFASKTGTRYHYDKSCLGLKRVNVNDLVSYPNRAEAKKKGLKSCDRCK